MLNISFDDTRYNGKRLWKFKRAFDVSRSCFVQSPKRDHYSLHGSLKFPQIAPDDRKRWDTHKNPKAKGFKTHKIQPTIPYIRLGISNPFTCVCTHRLQLDPKSQSRPKSLSFLTKVKLRSTFVRFMHVVCDRSEPSGLEKSYLLLNNSEYTLIVRLT